MSLKQIFLLCLLAFGMHCVVNAANPKVRFYAERKLTFCTSCFEKYGYDSWGFKIKLENLSDKDITVYGYRFDGDKEFGFIQNVQYRNQDVCEWQYSWGSSDKRGGWKGKSDWYKKKIVLKPGESLETLGDAATGNTTPTRYTAYIAENAYEEPQEIFSEPYLLVKSLNDEKPGKEKAIPVLKIVDEECTPICKLSLDQSPVIRGVKLGMSLVDFKSSFPFVEVSPLKTGRYTYKVAFFPYGSTSDTPDIQSLDVQFIEDKIVEIRVSFNSIREYYRKPNLYEEVSKKLNFQELWSSGKSKFECNDFFVEVMPDHTTSIVIWDKKGKATDSMIVDTAYTRNPPVDENLRSQLIAMRRADQGAREACSKKDADGQMKCYVEIAETIDKANSQRLEIIFETYGFPDAKLVGKDGVEAFYLLLQNSNSLDLKKKCLKGITRAFKEKVLSPSDYANFTDRLLLNLGKPQVYGANFDIKDGKLVMSETKDVKNLDKRRKRIGLPPIADYVKILKQAYNLDVTIPEHK